MTRFDKTLAVVIPLSEDARVNAWMERQGYGPSNVKRRCSATGSEPATHLCGESAVDSEMLSSMATGLTANPYVAYSVTERDSNALDNLIASANLAIIPPVAIE